MNCPQCKSDNVQKLSVIYDAGTHKINTTSSTFGSGVGNRGGFGIGTATTRTQGTSQTKAAEKAAPPKKKNYMWAAIIIAVGLFLSIESIAFILVLPIGGYLAYRAYTYNSVNYPPLFSAWEKQWMCNKCGEIYTA